ncbi:MAG TPA: GntR family transcriptional regulator [Erysipelothrix sp.]
MLRRESSVAVYRQIMEYFEFEIASGRLSAGDRIDSIRALALFFKVNPNTVQKALAELERDQLIFTDRTNGKFVTEEVKIIENLREKLAKELITEVVIQAKMLGLSKERTLTLIEDNWEDIQNERKNS